MNQRAETSVSVRPLALSAKQRALVERARALVRPHELEQLLAEMVRTPSPTGGEGALARRLVDVMAERGLDATYQPLNESQGNAIGRLKGAGGGPTLLLYGHLDTHLLGDDVLDAPAADGPLPAMSRPEPYRDGEILLGLGAGNPKAFAACMVAAAAALAEACAELRGDLVVGLAGGGMPTNAPPGTTAANVGQGAGCTFMLQHGIRADYAVIGKPGYAVAWEEVGICCFRIRLRGAFGYAGARHILAYHNSIVDAAHVVLALEEWCEQYTKRHTSGLVSPQAAVGFIQGGWRFKPAFIPAWTDIGMDVRISPRDEPMDIFRELMAAVNALSQRLPQLDPTVEMLLAIPGSRTEPSNWIIQSCMRAFEDVEQRPHEPILGTSGATDAEILRMWGIPTARLGMASDVREKTPTLERDMDSVQLSSMVRFVHALLYTIVDTCTRSLGATRR